MGELDDELSLVCEMLAECADDSGPCYSAGQLAFVLDMLASLSAGIRTAAHLDMHKLPPAERWAAKRSRATLEHARGVILEALADRGELLRALDEQKDEETAADLVRTALNRAAARGGFTAFHEAGHAVALVVFDFGCDEVTIKPDFEAESAGHASVFEGWDDEQTARNFVVMLLAGRAADQRAGCARRLSEMTSEDDVRQALEVLEHLGELDRLEAHQARAEAFVSEHWTAIERVAAELERVGRLDYEELNNLVDGSPEALEALDLYRAMRIAEARRG